MRFKLEGQRVMGALTFLLHGIVFNIVLYCRVLYCVARYSMVLHGIVWHCRVLYGICIVLYGIA